MNRRKFFAVVGGAVGAVLTTLGVVRSVTPYTGWIQSPLITAGRQRGVLAIYNDRLVWVASNGVIEPVSFSRVDNPNDWDFEATDA